MKAQIALRVVFLTLILILGSFFPLLFSEPVLANPSESKTTLYFVNALNYIDTENYSDFGFVTMSLSFPTKQNDSEYPPSLFIKNTSKFFPSLNVDQWVMWFGSSWLLYFLQDSDYFNFSDLFPGLEILFPHPFRVVEGYTYNGSGTLNIQGDFIYNLYFHSDITRPKFRDQVKVELYSVNFNSMLPLPKLIKNTTVKLTPGLFSDIYKQQIILPDISYSLIPGESLLFSVEIIPSNKTLPTLITKYIDVNRFLTRLEKSANWLENRSYLDRLKALGTAIKEYLPILQESFINITSEDFAAIINAMQSSSFVYDSVKHPSSVSIPGKISEEDIRIYYLHTDQTMDEKQPTASNQSGSAKITTTQILWTIPAPAFERNKILKMRDVFVDLYLDHKDLFRIFALLRRKITIRVILYDNNTTIGSSSKELDRMRIFGLLTKPSTPITFAFNASDTEITHGHSISFGVSLQNGTKLGLRSIKLLYDSVQFPSALRMKIEETDNIKIIDSISVPQNSKIIPGGTVEYTLTVTSKYADILRIETIEQEKVGDWEIDAPESRAISANNQTILTVAIKSKNNLKEAYGNSINLSIIVLGDTGIARQEVFAEVSEEAIEYKVEILGYSSNINMSKGENRSFYFVIKNNNTGAIDDVDSYTITATSKNHWPLIPLESIRNLGIGESTNANEARVVIRVPKNTTLTSDIITITVASDSDPSATTTITVTVHVIAGNIFESIYDLFNKVAESLGLNEMFGSYGAIVLVSLLMIIILFLLIILAFVFTTKSVQIICTDRIKEIDSTEQAIFELTLKNPRKKMQSYEIEAQQTAPSSKWILTIDPTNTVIEGRSSKTVRIFVIPTDIIAPENWTQVTVSVKITSKRKKESIALLAMIKEGKTLLQLQNVSHWPTIFNPGEKVITSFSLSNSGTISARNTKVFFYLNGKQKNMVEITLPAGNIADIQMPWIAEKGKNQIRIRVKEP